MSETPQASLLDELLREGVISRAQCDLYRSRYAKLHELRFVCLLRFASQREGDGRAPGRETAA